MVVSSVSILGIMNAYSVELSFLIPSISTVPDSSKTIVPTHETTTQIPSFTSAEVIPTSFSPTTSSSMITPTMQFPAPIPPFTSNNISPSLSNTNPTTKTISSNLFSSAGFQTVSLANPNLLTFDGTILVDNSPPLISTSPIPQPSSSTLDGAIQIDPELDLITINPIPNPSSSTLLGVSNSLPDCTGAVPNNEIIKQPNGKMVDISINGISDVDADTISVNIDSITQDEPTSGLKGNDKTPDGSGLGTDTAQVRAERDNKSDGRVYEISFTADDGNGGICSGSVFVSVPINKKSPAIDSGQNFDSSI